jgi:hypothetical protein
MPQYIYADLKSAITGRLHNQLDQMVDVRVALNNAVREVFSENDLRSAKRKSVLAPNLFTDIYQYACPSDLKHQKIVGIQPQTMDRTKENRWQLVGEEEFDQRKQYDKNLIAISDKDFTRKLLVSADINDNGFTLASLDSLTGDGGTWSVFGDAENLSVDTDDFIKGNASIKYDISSAGGTTAGIYNSSLSTADLTNYVSAGSIFIWAYVTSATNLTNFILRVGTDSSNYYSMTATTTNEGLSFSAGWNLVRFDFSGKSTTGTPTDTTINYVALYMTKAAGKISETDYRFDHIIVKKGKIFNVIYYTRYPWQNVSSVYCIDSITNSDYLCVDAEEFPLVVEKCVEHCAEEVRDKDDAAIAKNNYKEKRSEYRRNYRSEAIQSQSTYYYF